MDSKVSSLVNGASIHLSARNPMDARALLNARISLKNSRDRHASPDTPASPRLTFGGSLQDNSRKPRAGGAKDETPDERPRPRIDEPLAGEPRLHSLGS